jgi:TRAP-type C4-dicarboxylate transport system permease small subunit
MKIFKLLDEYFEIAVGCVLISLMTIIIFIQVVMRYVFQNSLVWSEELARYIFIWLIYLGLSYGAKMMKHIKIDAALSLFPKTARPYVVILGDILFLAFALFIIATSLEIVQKQLILGQTSPALQVPMWTVYAAPLVGFTLTAIRQIQTIRYRVSTLHEGDEFNG